MIITVKMWKELTSFEPVKDGELDIDGTVKMIAKIKGVPVEDVENLDMSELLPEYLACVKSVNDLVFSKVNKLPKNAEGDGQ